MWIGGEQEKTDLQGRAPGVRDRRMIALSTVMT